MDFNAVVISIHASAREATYQRRRDAAESRFQSTPPRGRRLQGLRTCGAIPHISIHASAREATSNHIIINLPTIYFNPRLREGGDKGEYASDFTEVISIHASAREATALITKIHLKHHISFQHTVHKSPFNVNYPFQ